MSFQISTEFTPLFIYSVFKELLSITLKIKEKLISAIPANAQEIYGSRIISQYLLQPTLDLGAKVTYREQKENRAPWILSFTAPRI